MAKPNGQLKQLKALLAKLDAQSPDAGMPIAELRRRREAAEMRIAELNLAAREGQLLDAERVRDAVSGMIIAARAKLLMIPSELCDKLAACSDPVRCLELIDGKICQALDELAEYPRRIAKT